MMNVGKNRVQNGVLDCPESKNEEKSPSVGRLDPSRYAMIAKYLRFLRISPRTPPHAKNIIFEHPISVLKTSDRVVEARDLSASTDRCFEVRNPSELVLRTCGFHGILPGEQNTITELKSSFLNCI
ncbi:hypothetical protein E3N88_13388 [Mikania micrantha]|uniref:Uncharacterized protein n=1 Tax=Mikania micrantha TaxID=192012 RepID=A0A5N6P9K7_9ASTR|nr:hypothetical protein E3N88_13388 [Mikania micrantha]